MLTNGTGSSVLREQYNVTHYDTRYKKSSWKYLEGFKYKLEPDIILVTQSMIDGDWKEYWGAEEINRIYFIKQGNVISVWNKFIAYVESKNSDEDNEWVWTWTYDIHAAIPELEPYHIYYVENDSSYPSYPYTYKGYKTEIYLHIENNDLKPIEECVKYINGNTKLGSLIKGYITDALHYQRILIKLDVGDDIGKIFISYLRETLFTMDSSSNECYKAVVHVFTYLKTHGRKDRMGYMGDIHQIKDDNYLMYYYYVNKNRYKEIRFSMNPEYGKYLMLEFMVIIEESNTMH